MITQALLKEYLHYNPQTGVWTWIKVPRRVRGAGQVHVGMTAGASRSDGRRVISFFGRQYRAARLAVLYMTGEWPSALVDHEDRDCTNDRWINLRSATKGLNNSNRNVQRNNKLGVKGVRRNHNCSTFGAHAFGKYIGSFATAEEAHHAHCVAINQEYHP